MDQEQHDSTISIELAKNCAQEQIHLLGTVQPHGFMMVINPVNQCIVQVSSGIVRHWPGLQDAYALIGTPVSEWVAGVNASDKLTIDFLSATNPVVLPWTLRFERTAGQQCGVLPSDWECLGHWSGPFMVLEWLPLVGSATELQRQNRVFADVIVAIRRLRRADRLNAFFEECAQIVQNFTDFDRIMIYRFLPDGCGEVIAEHTAAGYTPRFIGMRFPASDIPNQARALYLSNRLRILADVEATADTLVPPTSHQNEALDQSYCILRSMSPVHLSYLHNMGVRATMTLSIVSDGKLWGLIACHHHVPQVSPYKIREGMRQVCELIAEVATIRIDALSKLEAVHHRQSLDGLLNRFHQALILGGAIPTVLDAMLPEFLLAFHASGLGVQVGDVTYLRGAGVRQNKDQQILDAVATRLDTTSHSPTIQMWHNLRTTEARPIDGLAEVAGLMLAQRHDKETIFCFLTRPEVVQQVRWAGKPSKRTVTLPDGMVRLEPRHSFNEWQQSVRGRSQPWEQADADALTSLLQILSEVQKLQANQQLQQKLQWRAHHDSLTGLYNRRAMESEASARLNGERLSSSSALMLLDIDHFKRINDTYGHAVGDEVLQQLSQRLTSIVREDDLLARFGGDEFMLLIKIPQPSPTLVLAFSERLHQAVATPMEVHGQRLQISISAGIAVPPDHGHTISELLRRADLALYHAKAAGRSRSAVFEPFMESDQLDIYQLEQDLKEAIDKDQLSLVFQPKVDLTSLRVVGLEVLVRWRHPTRGSISPVVFIPIAERSDLIVRVDRWVMRRAIATQAQWRSQGLALLPIAVNLSMSDILSSNLVSHLSELLDEYQIPAAALEVEITESSMMRELERTRTVLLDLNQRGICISMDDFGTGFSSLSYLRHLPLQCLKIDQSFIQSMTQDTNAAQLTQAILAMGLALKMLVVAEGVETKAQMTWLIAHGCQIGQGYFFSPPVPAENVHQVIEQIEARLPGTLGACRT